MKYKLFGITWDIRPILICIWVVIGTGLFGTSFMYALEHKHVPAITLIVVYIFWLYVTGTLTFKFFNNIGE